MPLAPMLGYPNEQFLDVKTILIDTIKDIVEHDFIPRMVSESAGEIDIIHNSIVNNIYDDPIVVVDISGRNGNVMLELGLRLAFDKPVVIIKDNKTDYMFDISMIEHVTYPADLRHTEILKFQELLKEKIIKTYEKSLKDTDYSPFLKNFKHITVKTIGEETIGQSEALSRMDDKIDMIFKRVNNMYSSMDIEYSQPLNKRFPKNRMVKDIAKLMENQKIPVDIEPEDFIKSSIFKQIEFVYSKEMPSRGLNRFEVNELLESARNFMESQKGVIF
ncbi:hypothetical protein RV15_GL002166 [Enterococcus silesiacus]|nr:hypothetical protein RV15_GL002166 [Enterococcus silesiacus]